jgi:hydroxylamine reductase (hybrid-cluster protein)
MGKRVIRLTEQDIHRIVREALNETIVNGNFSANYFVKYLRKAYEYADNFERQKLLQAFPNVFRDAVA